MVLGGQVGKTTFFTLEIEHGTPSQLPGTRYGTRPVDTWPGTLRYDTLPGIYIPLPVALRV